MRIVDRHRLKELETEEYILSTNPVLYLPLHSLDGAAFQSRDSYGHLATVTGALWSPQGRVVDAVDDDIGIPDHASLKGMAGLTLEAWVNRTTSGNRCIIGKHSSGTDGSYYFQFAVSGLTFDFTVINSTPTRVDGSYPYTSVFGTFVHLVGVYDGAKMYFYANGVVSATTYNQTGIVNPANTSKLALGAINSPGLRQLGGILGEVRIYNRGLSAAEVRHNYLATKWRYQ